MRFTLPRRLLPVVAGMAMLALLAPAGALAHRRHSHHHSKRAHHARVSIIYLGPVAASTTPPSAPTPSTPGTTPKPTAPTTPTSEENAGKVASYTEGTLTLTLANGSVSGKVTAATRFECISATAAPMSGQDQDDEGGPGDDNGPGDDQNGGDGNQGGGWQGPQQSWGNGQWQGGDDNDDQGDLEAPINSEPPCDSGALVPGAIVRAAELRIAPGGSEFEIIELVR